MKHESWYCDRCERKLQGEPQRFAAFASISPLDRDKREAWVDVRVHLCQDCMDAAVKFLVGPSLRNHLETPRQLNAYTRHESEVPWRVKVEFKTTERAAPGAPGRVKSAVQD